jgi:hypothetical protein
MYMGSTYRVNGSHGGSAKVIKSTVATTVTPMTAGGSRNASQTSMADVAAVVVKT